MAYSNKFVACIIVDGHVQEEFGNGNINIPFGSEYTLRFRNKHDRRAVVQFFIDGENVSDGGYIIQPNSKLDIRRHATVDRAFKFVELDSEEAIEHGKNGTNYDKKKGLIEARFSLEKEKPQDYIHIHHYYRSPPICPNPPFSPLTGYNTWCSDNTFIGSVMPETSHTFSFAPPTIESNVLNQDEEYKGSILRSAGISNPPIKDGCTVEGSSTGQNFYTTNIDVEDTYTTVKLFLQGCNSGIMPSKSSKSSRISQKLITLEEENERLRIKIAKIENEKLSKQLEDLNR